MKWMEESFYPSTLGDNEAMLTVNAKQATLYFWYVTTIGLPYRTIPMWLLMVSMSDPRSVYNKVDIWNKMEDQKPLFDMLGLYKKALSD